MVCVCNMSNGNKGSIIIVGSSGGLGSVHLGVCAVV